MKEVFTKGLETLLDFNLKELAVEVLDGVVDSWEKFETQFNKSFKLYFETSIERYSKLPTVLSDKRENLLEIYQESFLKYEIDGDDDEKVILSADVQNILNNSSYSWITGYGGIGKSTMLKYFFLTSISQNILSGKIPVYIELRKYNFDSRERRGLLKFIYDEMKTLNFELEYKYFEYMVKNGRFLFLLDAFDEISSSHMEQFIYELDECLTQYKNNDVIITSRNMPKGYIDTVEQLIKYKTMGLTMEQGICLIKRLNTYPLDLRKSFIEKLSDNLFMEYSSLAQNPILLMLMLRTFGKNQNFPKEKSSFLLRVFSILYEEHDGTKLGGFKRKFKTEYNMSEISEVFSSFCFMTYFKYKGEKKAFSYAEVENILKPILKAKSSEKNISDLLYDLSVCLCLIYREGDNYYFVHNIFQEFYAAVYIYELDSKKQATFFVKQIVGNDELSSRSYNWRVFSTTIDYYKELDIYHNKSYLEENMILPVLNEIENDINFDGYENILFEEYGYRFISEENKKSLSIRVPINGCSLQSRFLYSIIGIYKPNIYYSLGKSEIELTTTKFAEARLAVLEVIRSNKVIESRVVIRNGISQQSKKEPVTVQRFHEEPNNIWGIPIDSIKESTLLYELFIKSLVYKRIEKLCTFKEEIEKKIKEDGDMTDMLLDFIN